MRAGGTAGVPGALAPLICTQSPAQSGVTPRTELRVRRGEERGGQDARSRVRPSLTSSKGTGGGGAGVNPGTASRPGCQRREWGWSRGGAGRGSSAGLLGAPTSQALFQPVFRMPDQVPAPLACQRPFRSLFLYQGKRLLCWGPLAANLLLAQFPYSASFLSAQLEAGPSVQSCQRGR